MPKWIPPVIVQHFQQEMKETVQTWPAVYSLMPSKIGNLNPWDK